MNNLKIPHENTVEIVGTQYENRADNHKGLLVGQKLVIMRQKDNSHDSNAVMICTDDGKELGFIPRGTAAEYARAMDDGECDLEAEVVKSELNDDRPILIIKITAKFKEVDEEAVTAQVYSLRQSIIRQYPIKMWEYLSFVDADSVDIFALIDNLNYLRVMKKMDEEANKNFNDDSLDNDIDLHEQQINCLTVDELLKYLQGLQINLQRIIDKYIRMHNSTVNLDDDDEIDRIEQLSRSRRKMFRHMLDFCKNCCGIIESYEPIKLMNDIVQAESEKFYSDKKLTEGAKSAEAYEADEVKEEPQNTVQSNQPDKKEITAEGGLILDFENAEEYTYSKPAAFSLLGNFYTISTWIDMYRMILKILYAEDEYKSKLRMYLNKRIINTARRIDFSDKPSMLKRSCYISSDFYMEANLSAKEIVKRIGRVLEICSINPEDLRYWDNNSYDPKMRERITVLKSKAEAVAQDYLAVDRTAVVDFTVPEAYTFCKPLLITFYDGESVERHKVAGWNDVHFHTVKLIYKSETYRNKLYNCIGKRFAGSNSPDFVSSNENTYQRKIYKIAPNLWMYEKRGPYSIIRFLRQVLDECDISYDNLKITYIDNRYGNSNDDLEPAKADETALSKESIQILEKTKSNDLSETDNIDAFSDKIEEPAQFVLKDALIAILQSDEPKIKSFRTYKNGMTAKSLSNLIKSNYKKNVGIFEIVKTLKECEEFISVGRSCYALSKSVYGKKNSKSLKEAESSKLPSIEDAYDKLNKTETFTKQAENTVTDKIIPDNTQNEDTAVNIKLRLGERETVAYDSTDAIKKICEFAIRCKPFDMAGIDKNNIYIGDKALFCRSTVPKDGYDRLSNNLQMLRVNSLNTVKCVVEKLTEYCNIDSGKICFLE